MKSYSDGDEFYVGYLPQAPEGIKSTIRKVIYVLTFVVICLAGLLALKQKKFSTSTFEYGIKTELEGFIFRSPVAHLMLPVGKDFQGKDIYQTVMLVGFGKSGASAAVRKLMQNKNDDGSRARLSGSLIYGDGKMLLQLDEESDIELLDGSISTAPAGDWESNLEISGEIVDPKCYFGVMKPGEGNIHRSCAIRCIAGGIPPVFTSEANGYYILVDENNESVSTKVIDIVGDRIMLMGDALQWNDWKILRVESKFIDELASEKKLRLNLMTFQQGMPKCSHDDPRKN